MELLHNFWSHPANCSNAQNRTYHHQIFIYTQQAEELHKDNNLTNFCDHHPCKARLSWHWRDNGHCMRVLWPPNHAMLVSKELYWWLDNDCSPARCACKCVSWSLSIPSVKHACWDTKITKLHHSISINQDIPSLPRLPGWFWMQGSCMCWNTNSWYVQECEQSYIKIKLLSDSSTVCNSLQKLKKSKLFVLCATSIWSISYSHFSIWYNTFTSRWIWPWRWRYSKAFKHSLSTVAITGSSKPSGKAAFIIWRHDPPDM